MIIHWERLIWLAEFAGLMTAAVALAYAMACIMEWLDDRSDRTQDIVAKSVLALFLLAIVIIVLVAP